MGFTCRLREVFSFTYKVQFENGLSENEYDHVFVGKFDGTPKPNPEEVADWKWISMDKLKKDIEKNPNNYTYWLKVVIDKMIEFTKY